MNARFPFAAAFDEREADPELEFPTCWEIDSPVLADPLAIAATEYVAAEARLSPYWLALMALAIGGAILAVLAI